MKIALDYDGTYTTAPGLWDSFIESCKGVYEVTIVTMRFENTENITEWIDCPIIYTGRKAKKAYCLGKGVHFDIWVDDNPEWIFFDSR